MNSLRYPKLRLDTLPSQMRHAVSLYGAVGFKIIPPYWINTIPGIEFMELEL